MHKLTPILICIICFSCDDRNPVKEKVPVYSAKDLAFVSELIEMNEGLSFALEVEIKEEMVEIQEDGESLFRITRLDLSQKNITILPESIGNLDSLTSLNIEGNGLEELPDTLCTLIRLEEALTNGNNLCVPSTYPFCLSSQINIYLQNCESYPDENDQEFIDELIVMNSLNDSVSTVIQSEKVVWSTVLDEDGLSDRITELDLASLGLDTIPFSIGGLKYLHGLELDNNQLTAIPESFGSLDSLRILDIYNNQISILPHNLGQLTHLEQLRMYSNKLTSLDFDFSGMTKLYILEISFNQISSIDSSICSIYDNLDDFFFSQNQLCDNLPACLENVINQSEQDCGD